MDPADLDHRARTRSGCIPPELVSRLLHQGHATVVEEWAGRGEWFCALVWARLLGERGRQADALEVLAPYTATGWWTAVVATAELLEGWGRTEQAIETVRARMAVGHPMALEAYTRLLARQGRAEEAFTMLLPHADDWALATALVDVAAVAGRDEEAAALLAARIRADHRCDGPWCCRGLDPDTAIGLLATIRERQGHIDEAIALLRHRQITSVNSRDQLADSNMTAGTATTWPATSSTSAVSTKPWPSFSGPAPRRPLCRRHLHGRKMPPSEALPGPGLLGWRPSTGARTAGGWSWAQPMALPWHRDHHLSRTLRVTSDFRSAP